MTRVNTLTPAANGRRKAALERKFRELASITGRPDELRIESMADPMDLVQTKADRDIAVAELDYRAAMMRDVHSALAKMRTGEYGVCEECEEAISPRRLDAVPWARLCIRCQEKTEQAGTHSGMIGFDRAA